MAEVLPDPLDPRPPPRLAADFRVPCRTAELPLGLLARFLFPHAGFPELVNSLCKMGFHLVGELPGEASEFHGSAGRITLAMPSIIRSKLDTSLVSCFRPAAVSL